MNEGMQLTNKGNKKCFVKEWVNEFNNQCNHELRLVCSEIPSFLCQYSGWFQRGGPVHGTEIDRSRFVGRTNDRLPFHRSVGEGRWKTSIRMVQLPKYLMPLPLHNQVRTILTVSFQFSCVSLQTQKGIHTSQSQCVLCPLSWVCQMHFNEEKWVKGLATASVIPA